MGQFVCRHPSVKFAKLFLEDLFRPVNTLPKMSLHILIDLFLDLGL